MYINKKDYTGESARMGQTAEDLFENWLKLNNRKYRKATLSEQFKHIDFIVNSDKLKKEIKIDVKASKKLIEKTKLKILIFYGLNLKMFKGKMVGYTVKMIL